MLFRTENEKDSDNLERVFQQTPFLEEELIAGLPKKKDSNGWEPLLLLMEEFVPTLFHDLLHRHV